MKVYNKLVRDKIPEIIEADGKSCKTKILSDEEYLKMIDAKLDEELAEIWLAPPCPACSIHSSLDEECTSLTAKTI